MLIQEDEIFFEQVHQKVKVSSCLNPLWDRPTCDVVESLQDLEPIEITPEDYRRVSNGRGTKPVVSIWRLG